MVLMAVCGVLLAVGLIAAWRWGGLEFCSPATEPGRYDVVRRFLWYVAVGVVAGLGAGVLVAGAGGRLVMRLLAVTSPEDAQGRITEADEVVGEITVGGTIGFLVFTGLFFGLITGVLYLLVRRWLPAGRFGGLAFGALLLVGAGTRIEPLRADNSDFDLVGPSWLALIAFSSLVVAHGVLVAALAARYASTLPLVTLERRVLLRYAPLLLLVPAVPLVVVLVLIGLVVVGLSRVEPIGSALRARWTTVVGRVALVVAALVALPGFVTAVVDIADRGP